MNKKSLPRYRQNYMDCQSQGNWNYFTLQCESYLKIESSTILKTYETRLISNVLEPTKHIIWLMKIWFWFYEKDDKDFWLRSLVKKNFGKKYW